MTTSTLRITSLTALIAMFFSSCATTADGRKTQGQGAAVGAVLGAALLGGLAAATGGNVGQMAAIGAGLGGAAGFAYGSEIAKKKASYANKEDFLAYAIGEAQTRNANAAAFNDKLAGEVSALERQVKSMPKAPAQRDELKLQLNNTLSSIETQDKKLTNDITALNDALQGNGYGDKPQSATLRTEISKLEAKKEALKKYNSRIAASQARIAI